MSINQVAQAADLSQNFLSAVLRGEKVPSVVTLQKLADAFGVPAWWLIYDTTRGAPQAPNPGGSQ